MTFPWGRILFMLVIVSVAALLQLNSRVYDFPLVSQVSPLMYDCSTRHISVPEPGDDCHAQASLALSAKVSDDSQAQWPLAQSFMDSTYPPGSYKSDAAWSTDKNLHLGDNDDVHYVPTYSARYISIVQHKSDHTKPHYVLAFEFFSPPVPSLTIGYQINFSPQLDWVLTAASPASRLSAWKDSNLLYIHSQLCQFS